MLNEEILVPLFFFITVIALAVGIPLARALARRMDRQRVEPPVGPEVLQRLERMEHAIEAVAVEIERISENQRFMTRLMTETQLAGTIAAVRGSTEAARAAAEKANNA